MRSMQARGFSWFRWALLLAVTVLAGCSNTESGTQAGVIAFEEGSGVMVKRGHTRDVVLSLKHGNGVSGQRVSVESGDPLLADVSPASCTLSSSSDESSRCSVRIHAKNTGLVMLFARSAGYAEASLPATVTDTLVYGSLTVVSPSGTVVSSGSVTASFNATGSPPFQLPLTARIAGSSGIVGTTGVIINFSSLNASLTFSPPQCPVTSAAPDCNTVVSFSTATTATIQVQVVGAVTAAYPDYSRIAVNAVPNATPSYGTITLSTQSGNNVPNGMKAPLFVNWLSPSIQDAVTVTLAIVGDGVSFYSYAPGDNTTIKASKILSCPMRYTGVAANDTLGCGFGMVGHASGSTVTVHATVTSRSTNAYVVAPLTLGAVDPEPTRRAVTFTNQSSQPIFVGITGGSASSYTNPTTPAVGSGPTGANMKPGAGSLCGPSNPAAACPIGTSCTQGGANPGTDIAKTPFYCYYDQKTPTNGYEIAAKTGTTTFEISGSSLAPSGIIWSGNFYARTGCDPVTGVCENATCVGKQGGLMCGPGTGPLPGVNTLAELTFQAYPATDFYDVSIINGANFAMQFAPPKVPLSTTDPYFCTAAGSFNAQNGGYPGTTTQAIGLPAASWTMTPSVSNTTTTSASFPPGVVVTGDAASYYRVVVPSTATAAACTRNADCTGPVDTTCGFAMSAVTGAAPTFAGNLRTCGKPVAWMTADAIWGFNKSATNLAPFAFNTSWPGAGTATVSVGDLQLCINNTYSAYTANGTSGSSPAFPIQPIALACGGVMWGATESPLPLQNPGANAGLNLTRPSNPVQTANPNWLAYVLPTIQWLKQACPTCYTYPFDDPTSTFTCRDNSRSAKLNYGVVFGDLK